MAVDEDMKVECCSVTSLPGTSHQEPAVASTSQLIESSNIPSRPSSLNAPDILNQHVTPGILNITSNLEHSLWTRFKPLIKALEEPLNQYLHTDVAYRGCIQQLKICQQSLLQENLSRDEIDHILDKIEKELLCAQYLALWKRGVLLGADKSLYKLTGRKCDPKFENPAVVKSKRKCKKTAVSTVKESVRRSKRERSSLCTTKTKSKDVSRGSTFSTPRQTPVSIPSNSSRTKRKNKRRESTSESTTGSKRRSSGRVTKPPRKKQGTTADSCEVVPVSLNDEPTYCLCKQVSFGDMILCDNDKCTVEWFHFGCVQLKTKPKGKWYCPLCRGDRTNILRSASVR